MFITRRSHDEVVALYEARLAELAHERDVYRSFWLERLGVKYPAAPPKPSETTTVTPGAPGVTPSDLEDRKTFRLDRSEWTRDDIEWYDDYHARPMLEAGAKVEELDYLYFQKYGHEKPLAVFLDRAFPVE